METFSSSIAAQAVRFRLPGDLVQDVVQETLIRALRGLERFRGEAKLSTWVYRIAYRECLRAKERHLRHQGGVVSLDPMSDPEGGERDATDVAEREDEVQRVGRMMSRLPDDQRLVLGYHYLEGMGVAEIADLMGSTSNTVKSWLKRGRETLRDLLGESTS